MLNPKLIPFHKNLPEITDKRELNALRKGMFPATNSSFLHLEKISDIIINTHALPVEIHLQCAEGIEATLLVTSGSISVKGGPNSGTLPLQISKKNWLKIALSREFSRAEVRNKFNENKISKTNVYSSSQQWKNDHPQEQFTLATCTIGTLLASFANNQAENNQKRDRELAGLVRTKLSERANSFSHKESLAPRKQFGNSIHMTIRGDSEKNGISGGKKYDSATLNFNSYFQNREKIAKRTASTSNSLRSESRDVRFSKKQQKMVQAPSQRQTYVPSFYAEPSQFVPITQAKQRPRFYQQIPLSHEQIDLKRKKFDSQFISKKDSPLLNITKTNESEVTEDIIKCENSRLGHQLDDTFQRGIINNQGAKAPNGTNLQAADESGTLCESVFE